MKSMRWIVALLLLAALGNGNAWADRGHRGGGHRGHGHFGVVINPFWGPWYVPPSPYYYPPYYRPYYPPVAVAPASPPIYIEQPAAAQAAPAPEPGYWYYCNAAKAYYPYVSECPSGWQKVLPQPQGSRDGARE